MELISMPGIPKAAWLGMGFVVFGFFLQIVAIPYAVTSPSNVQILVLSPTFWPTIISWLIIMFGGCLALLQFFAAAPEQPETSERTCAGAWLRLTMTALVIIAIVCLTPVVGLVWISMASFAALSLIVGTSRPIISGIVAIALPLALYGFFNHIAGVAIPQGSFVTLP